MANSLGGHNSGYGDGVTSQATGSLGTVVSGGGKHGLVAAFLAKHYGGPAGHPTPGQGLDEPAPSVTSRGQLGPVAVWLDKLHGSARAGQPIDRPAPTVTTGGGRGGGHAALVAAFLTTYYGTAIGSSVAEPLPAVVTRDRFGLVLVHLDGEPYVLADIGMRMLQPRELATAQGFGPEYVLTGTKSSQVAKIGNSVCPPVAEALVRTLLAPAAERRTA